VLGLPTHYSSYDYIYRITLSELAKSYGSTGFYFTESLGELFSINDITTLLYSGVGEATSDPSIGDSEWVQKAFT